MIEVDNVLKIIILRNFEDPTQEIERLKNTGLYKGYEIWIIVRTIKKIQI